MVKGGSIPACAGEPLPSTSLTRHRRVYPRVCGGTSLRFGWSVPGDGLSPRVRGNPDGQFLKVNNGGSIPACAGEPP